MKVQTRAGGVVLAIASFLVAAACSSTPDRPPVATTGQTDPPAGGGSGSGSTNSDGGATETASDDSGVPVEGGVCNSTTCLGGCCDALNHCQPGNLNAACGITGGACLNCTTSNTMCSGGGCF